MKRETDRQIDRQTDRGREKERERQKDLFSAFHRKDQLKIEKQKKGVESRSLDWDKTRG